MAASKIAAHDVIHALYCDHHTWLQSWLRKHLPTPGDAPDLAHDTFVRVMARPCDWSGVHNPRAFLTTVAKGLMLDLRRRQLLEREYLDALALLPASVHPSEEDRALVIEALRLFDRVLDGLAPRARMAFLYSRIEGMKQDDIARRLGVSAVTVRQYLAQAMRRWVELQDQGA